jgi:hypothetical protein
MEAVEVKRLKFSVLGFSGLLNDFEIEFEEKYLFEFFDDLYTTPTELGNLNTEYR